MGTSHLHKVASAMKGGSTHQTTMAGALLGCALWLGCGASTPPPSTPVQVLEAAIIVNECTAFGPSSAKLAEKAMDNLVRGCTEVPGGAAAFTAMLVPGGRIEITATPGAPGVVPICVLAHPLVHRVPLRAPCRLDVRLEQTHMKLGPHDSAP